MIIESNIIAEIFSQAEREAPIEACGYLAGADGHITRYYPLTNTEGRADHFSLDPVEQFAAHKQARQEGLRILSIYHSHPASPARPSVEDVKLAYDPELLYMILSLLNGDRTVKGFRIRQGKVEEEKLIIKEKP